MTATPCPCCETPTPDAYVCQRCGSALAGALREAAGHAEDAPAVLARQARYGTGSRGGSEEPLPVDLTASTRYAAVSLAANGWMSVLIEEGYAAEPEPWRPLAGPLCPPVRPGDEPRKGNRCEHRSCAAIRDQGSPSPLARVLAWLAANVGLLRRHPDAKTAFAELHAAAHQLARLVDRPADKDLVGMCDCGKTLYAAAGRREVTCPVPTCQLTWHVERSREILLRALDDRLMTAGEAAKLAVRLDDGDRSTEQVRKLINKWGVRSELAAKGSVWREPNAAELKQDPDHPMVEEPLYRFGDVAERLARTQRREPRDREGAAA
jgi:hypothetical protein